MEMTNILFNKSLCITYMYAVVEASRHCTERFKYAN